MAAIEWVLLAMAVYLFAGLVFGAVFVARFVGAIDPAAKASGWPFRLLILPGVMALWPCMLLKWRHARRAFLQ